MAKMRERRDKSLTGAHEASRTWRMSRRVRRWTALVGMCCTLVASAGCAVIGGRANEHLLQQGVRARAVVVSITETGWLVNRRPECEIVLRVEPRGGESYVTSVREVVSLTQIPQLQPGRPVAVRYDPNNRKEVVIEALGEPATASISEKDVERMALEGQALHLELNATGAGVPASAIVLRFDPTGAVVNGDNPLAALKVKVLAPDGAPYDAQIVGVFNSSTLDKYTPGREIHVRFDPANRQRVAVDLDKMGIARPPK